MPPPIIYDKEYIKNLELWIERNEQKFAEYLGTKKSLVPQMFRSTSAQLYRGMIVGSDFLNAASSTSGLKFKALTSWSKTKVIATKFITDRKFDVAAKDGTKIILTIKPKLDKVVLDIEALYNFLGEDELTGTYGMDDLAADSMRTEREVLMDKGLVIKMKDIAFI